MWKWYVYELRDPESLEVFYVGKGCEDRLYSHKSDEVTNKGLKILDINAKGKEPLRVIVGRFENEEQAFAVEATLIKWVYGKNNLKNSIQGHAHKFIRPREQLIDNRICPVEGIDAPPKDGMNFMRLMELDRAIEKIRDKSQDLAAALEDLVGYFVDIVNSNIDGTNLVYRASETRISFFAAQLGSNINLQKRQPADPVARIFFKSSLNKGGRLHLSFTRDPKTDITQISNTQIEVRLGMLGGKIDDKKIDVILSNPVDWRASKEVITKLLLSSLKR